MTVRDLLHAADHYTGYLIAFYVGLPVAALMHAWVHGRGNGERAPWRYGYTALVYLACLPGMFALALTAYAVIFRNDSLLDADVLTYFLPIVSMVLTLVVIVRNVNLDHVPGFRKLSGLAVMLFTSFFAALLLQRLHVVLIFFGNLLLVAAVIFALLYWSTHALFGGRSSAAARAE